MDKVRLAIVGCGTISQLNAPGYLAHENCEVVALCDPARERAEGPRQGVGHRARASILITPTFSTTPAWTRSNFSPPRRCIPSR